MPEIKWLMFDVMFNFHLTEIIKKLLKKQAMEIEKHVQRYAVKLIAKCILLDTFQH